MMRMFLMAVGLAMATCAACGEPAVAEGGADLVRESRAVSGTVALTLSLLGDSVELSSDSIQGRLELTAVPGVSTAVEVLELELGDLAMYSERAPFPVTLHGVRIESTAVAWSTGEERRATVPCALRAELRDPEHRRLPVEIAFALDVGIYGGDDDRVLLLDGAGDGGPESFPLALERAQVYVLFE